MKAAVKSVWAHAWDTETGAPEKRIIHGQYIKFPVMQEKVRIGVKLGDGYFKCGSEKASDWVSDFAAYQWDNEQWVQVLYVTGIKKPENSGDVDWYELPKACSALLLEVRKSGVDGWWPCYNLAKTGFMIEPNELRHDFGQPLRRLHQVTIDLDEDGLLKEMLSVTRTSCSVRFSSPYYSIGFRLKSAGLDFLALDGTGSGKTCTNLLAMGSMLTDGDEDFLTQGPVINPLSSPSICGFLSYDAEGRTEIRRNSLIYRINHQKTGLALELAFTMKATSILLSFKLKADRDITLMDYSLFRMAFDSRKAPVTALGKILKTGETGVLEFPLLLSLPGYSVVRLEGTGQARGRFNSIRPKYINTFDFLLGEPCTDEGCYSIKKGEYEGTINMIAGYENPISLRNDTPKLVRTAFEHHIYTCLPYRADTATFSNNGSSIGAPICMDLWADLCDVIRSDVRGVDALEYLKNTIEIHLSGAPAYASGLHLSGLYRYEDMYLMTGTAVLLGIARYLEMAGTKGWYTQYKEKILSRIEDMKKRDIDGDGLIESPNRRGISGEHQWSTCWYDVISYGYKDAFSNALLYPALRILAVKISEYGDISCAKELDRWADRIKAVYSDTFMTENEWFGGWRDMDGKLHDYGFLAVNGAAVSYGLLEGKMAHSAMNNLWQALLKTGYDSFDMGLPGNIFSISSRDMAEPQKFLPFGGYQNGGITLSQSRHFINGLLCAGLHNEAEYILTEICKGLLYGSVIGGVGSGCDWKTWDGISSGYEGLLCDQLGVFQPLFKRYALMQSSDSKFPELR